jgi:hypothetical protein
LDFFFGRRGRIELRRKAENFFYIFNPTAKKGEMLSSSPCRTAWLHDHESLHPHARKR